MTVSSPAILVFAEQQDGVLKGSARELLAAAGCWPGPNRPEVSAVTLGANAERAAVAIAGMGVSRVSWMEEGGAVGTPLRQLRTVASMASEVGAGIVLFSDSSVGRDLAPRLAARLGGCFLSGVLSAGWKEGRVQVTRPLFGGRFVEELAVDGDRLWVLTWSGYAPPMVCAERSGTARVQPISLNTDTFDDRVRLKAAVAGEGQDLSQAEVVVCGGRGVGSKDGFQLIYDLAEAMGGVPAASRAAVDAGYAPPELQVGQSGKSVRPRLYVAMGVSGSLQHRAGMRNSRCVVAVNRDPLAPIMQWADYGIVGEWKDVARALLRALTEQA